MPIVEISKKDLERLIGKKISIEELRELLLVVKGEIENVEDDLIKIEIKDINRPDLWSTSGISRELKGELGKEKGLPKFNIKKGNYKVIVSNELKNIRPLTVCAVLKNLKFDDFSIKQLIQLQEKLSENFGLGRKEAALGIYDFDKIVWPVHYKAVLPDEVKFVPLEFSESLTLKQILQKHPKGQQYAKLLEGQKKYPLFVDSAGNVLSMPPIINSDYTGKITETTKNAFIEVTGFSYRFIVPVLIVMVSEFAERGCIIETVSIETNGKRIETPDFKEKEIKIDIENANNILGLNLKANEIVKLLEKRRIEAILKNKEITVKYPAYRQDIMNSRDIIEEIAISYGYNKFKADIPEIATIGRTTQANIIKEKITELLIGLGMQEVATFSLISKENLFKKTGVDEKQKEAVELKNPISLSYECLRNSLIPSILEFLSINVKSEYPQKIFEIGEIVEKNKDKAKTKLSLCIAISYGEAGFTEIKRILEYVLNNLGKECKIKEAKHPSFIDGRAGKIIIDAKDGGVLGEISPKVLENFHLKMPAALLELNLSDIFT